jgi:hypothetical protein
MIFDPKAAAEAVMEDVPSIDVTNQADAADWLRGELGKGELSGIFLREDMLVTHPASAKTATSLPPNSDSKTPDRHKYGPSRHQKSKR